MIQVLHLNRVRCFGTIGGLFLAFYPIVTQAQITGDATLGTQVNGSLAAPCTGVCNITNGSNSGSNLFHSFQQFSLPNPADRAIFQTTPAIQNLFVRVTGTGQPFVSNINGLIQTSNPTNFFLLNPNGIIFGPGAGLNIGGSFLATTADRMLFQDGQFSPADPAALLSVKVPIGLQFNATPGNIQMQGSFFSPENGDSFSDFALVGGDITLNNAIVEAPGYRVELAGVGENGLVGFRLNGDQLSLSLAGTLRRDISLTKAFIDTSASNGAGKVVATGRNIVLDKSSILTGISTGIDNALSNQAGDITIDAAATLQLTQGSRIDNLVRTNAIGQGGNLAITANTLRMADSSQLAAVTLGQGNAGRIFIQAVDTVSLAESYLFNTVEPEAIGNSGGIMIRTGSLNMIGGAEIDASTSGQGNAGDVKIQASNRIVFDGVDADDFASGVFSTVKPGAVGNGGNIAIKTGYLTLSNGGRIQTNIRDRGNAGNVLVEASRDVLIDGVGTSDPSQIATTVGTGGVGTGGDIQIIAQSLFVTNGGAVNASTFGQGSGGNVLVRAADRVVLDGVIDNRFASSIGSEVGFDRSAGIGDGGNVSIETHSLLINNGANISTSTRSQGNAGNVTIQASGAIVMGGIGSDGSLSLLSSGVNPGGVGNGGDVDINAELIVLREGAQVVAATAGQGKAGNLNLKTSRSIVFDGVSAVGLSSGAFATVNPGGIGQGGNIDVTTPYLLITNGGAVVTSTSGQGDSGNITIRARDSITFDGVSLDPTGDVLPSRAFSRVRPSAIGNGGEINIITDSLTLTKGAQVSSSSEGNGSAGKIEASSRLIRLDNQSSITTETASGNGGDIKLQVGELLLLRQRSLISTTAGIGGADGDGGNIKIDIPKGFIVGIPLENSDITANASQGKGGRVDINPKGIFGIQKRDKLTDLSDITASSASGPTGIVNIAPPDVDPNRGLVPLPVVVTDPSNKIDQQCAAGTSVSSSQFVVTGRGGLPASPEDNANASMAIARLATIPANTSGTIEDAQKSTSNHSKSAYPNEIVEAQTTIRQANGLIRFVVASRFNSSPLTVPAPNCQNGFLRQPPSTPRISTR
jgi:filamentous hemagglutinin family protein